MTLLLISSLALGLSAGQAWARGRHGAGEGPGLGLGDVYALCLIGAFFGLEGTLQIVFWAALGAVLVLLGYRLLTRGASWTGRRIPPVGQLPFVTFLALSALWFLLLDPAGPHGAGVPSGKFSGL